MEWRCIGGWATQAIPDHMNIEKRAIQKVTKLRMGKISNSSVRDDYQLDIISWLVSILITYFTMCRYLCNLHPIIHS
jgi:hypothetical protein